MKKKLLFISATIACLLNLSAQTENDPIPIVSWKISERLGNITPTPFDTIVLNFQNRNIPDGFSTAYGYTGNLMLPGHSKIFFDRPDDDIFIFKNGFHPFIKRPENFNFSNTKIPYSNLTYTWGGGTANEEERFSGMFSANVNKKWNVGAYFDYVYARGFYSSQAAKQTNFVLFSNYLSDKYVLHFFAGLDNINNFENGGVSNDLAITNPEAVDNGSRRPFGSKDVGVAFNDEGNKINDKQIYLNHRYNLGFYRKIDDSTRMAPVNQIDALTSGLTVKGKVYENEEDSLGAVYRSTERTKEFVPVTSLIHTAKYTYNSRHFTAESIPKIYDSENKPIGNYYPFGPFLTAPATLDSTSYFSLKNTFGISLLEGFNKYAKAGLSVFIENDIRSFRLVNRPFWEENPLPELRYNENATYIGGEFSKKQGPLLTYDFKGELGILGSDLGQFKISGNMRTQFRLWKDVVALRAYGHLYNLVPTFYQKRYNSNFYQWNNRFNDQRRLRLGGVLSIPTRNLSLDVGVENLQNYIYFNKLALPTQTSENIQVLSAKLNYDFNYRAFHWDNELVYQTTSDKSTLPLPTLSLYSNMYLWFKMAKVLQVQLGTDLRYHTKYHALAYQPAISQFYLQDEVEIGEYPLVNAYINMYLKKTRFFVMAYHVNHSAGNYFSVPHYPINPFHIRFGVSASFND